MIAVFERGLSSAVGVRDNVQRVKMAIGFANHEPDQVFSLVNQNWISIMGERGVGDLGSVEPNTTAKLDKLGITTVAQLAGEDRGRPIGEFVPYLGNWFNLPSRGGGDINISNNCRTALPIPTRRKPPLRQHCRNTIRPGPSTAESPTSLHPIMLHDTTIRRATVP
ncbi:hypothetical protein K9U37_14065 [Mycolicibacterium litorale]|uniref:Uncharacterized protein n=1 Tax=Candidatus Mycolicibacterium alkanivorans TaxID=2954114 RepID=A0ABS9YXJ6_9MYCO|nr:hypothetical protein [Candidatus Mycolicibacterium alkanivorans]